MINLLMRDLSPHLGHGSTQFCCCAGSPGKGINPSLHDVPKVFDWVEIRRSSRMRQKVHAVVTQEVLGSTCSMGTGIVLLEQAVPVPLDKWNHIGTQDLIDVAVCIDTIPTTLADVLKDDRSHSLIDTNGALYHDAGTSPSIMLQDVIVSKPLSRSSPDPDTPIARFQAKALLVQKENPPPVPMAQVGMLLGPG